MLIYLSFLIMASFSSDDNLSKGMLFFTFPADAALIQQDDPEEGIPDESAEYPVLKGFKKEKSKTLLKAFKNRNPKKRDKAIKDMVKLGRAVIPLLFENAEKAKGPFNDCIVQSIEALTDERDITFLKQACASKNDVLRAQAIKKISGFRTKEYHGLIKNTLEDENTEVRLEAALGLVWLKDSSGLGEIITCISKDLKSPPERFFKALPNLRGELMYRKIFDLLVHDKDPNVRTATVVVLTEIGGESVFYLLKKALEDSDAKVQKATVNGLRKLVDNAPPRSFDTLFELVEAVNQWKKRLSAVKQNG